MSELWAYPEIEKLDREGTSLLFESCTFDDPVFKNCHFRGVSFDESVLANPQATGCDFDGIDGAQRWWEGLTITSPAEEYKSALLEAVRSRLGEASWTYRRVLASAEKFPGREFRLKWSAYVIDGGIPESEYEALEEIVDTLRERFA